MTDEFESRLDGRLGIRDINEILSLMSSSESFRDSIIETALTDIGRRGANALWCLTHYGKADAESLQPFQDQLIDKLLANPPVSQKRMILQILRGQTFSADTVRSDLLDYCLSKINAECEPYAVRCFSLYIAYEICRVIPELMTELNERLELLSFQDLSPGLKCARRKIAEKIRKKK